MKTECPYCGAKVMLMGEKIGFDCVAKARCDTCNEKFCVVENISLKFSSVMLRGNNPSSRGYSQ